MKKSEMREKVAEILMANKIKENNPLYQDLMNLFKSSNLRDFYKINDKGQVWCKYHQKFEDKGNFKKYPKSPTGYAPFCIEAKKLHTELRKKYNERLNSLNLELFKEGADLAKLKEEKLYLDKVDMALREFSIKDKILKEFMAS